jgi:phospholipid/cholesterol/gamma-HCH transport system permease protein
VQPPATIEREGRNAIARLHGDLTRDRAKDLLRCLRGAAKQRGAKALVLDFGDVQRLDSSAVAVISLISKQVSRGGRTIELANLGEQHKAALEMLPGRTHTLAPREPIAGAIERLGGRVIDAASGAARCGALVRDTVRETLAVMSRRKKLPSGSLTYQISTMGVDAIFIVGLLSFLLGMTMAFQGAVQLQRFGAAPFVADLVGMSMVRELSPLMTAVILTGRTGASIAAELGTMQVRSEIDALTTMGIEPVRFLIVPRIGAITVVGPTLTLMSMFIGIFGGALVASMSLGLPVFAYWDRVVARVDLGDFAHGMAKSLVFAWIIGFTGSHLGLRAGGDASSVGHATTRAVVVAIFLIIVVDAIFATLWPVGRSTL